MHDVITDATMSAYAFGPFRLDAAAGQLRRGDEVVPLAPKAFAVLEHLIRKPGQLVTKDELLELAWSDVHVGDGALKVCIREVRRALHDDPRTPTFIETAHRRGYRFIAPVALETHSQPHTPAALVLPVSGPSALAVPETHYARSGDINIAYQVIGGGPIDLVFIMGWVSHLEYFWVEPSFARFLDRHGYLAGQDRDRADDINRFFADTAIRAVLPIRGGWGSSRLLPYLDYELIRRNPKIILGYSDITALLLAIHARTGLITFHGPNGMGRWDEFSVGWVKRVLFDAEAATLENPREKGEFLVQTENRTQTLAPGAARGRLLGGNLTVLSAIIGSPYLPDWEDSILFLEDVGEELYRVDRMLTTLKLAGVLPKIRGFVFGTCSECEPGSGYASLTMEEIFNDHIKPLKVPAWRGAMIGHRMPQFTLAEGLEVEIDASAGRIRMLQPAVA